MVTPRRIYMRDVLLDQMGRVLPEAQCVSMITAAWSRKFLMVPPRAGGMGRDGDTVMGLVQERTPGSAVLIPSQQENQQEVQKTSQRCR